MDKGRSTKSAIKRAVKASVAVAGRFVPPRRNCARILTYHSVGFRAHEMNVVPEAFRAQMEWLAHNARILSLPQAAAGEAGVAVTFDGGDQDNLEHAAPILEELAIPATVFLVPGRMGGFLDHDAPDPPSRLLSWDEALELERRGVTLGAHTMHHARLSGLSEAEQREEVRACGRVLAERLGHAVEAFAYPFGSARDYDASSIALVQEAGFSFAFSNRYGVHRSTDSPWTIRRMWIDSTDSLASFQDKVCGRLDILSLLDTPPAIRARRLLNRFLRT